MLVVSDTSPLSNLAVIGRLELLREQFGQVRVPPAVARELKALSHRAGQLALAQAFAGGWLVETSVATAALFPPAIRGLDAGETEALRLALSSGASRVLMDEKEGRHAAVLVGLRCTGAIGVLIAARQTGRIDSLAAEISRLRHEAGFFVDSALEQRALEIAGEAAPRVE